MIEIIMGDSFQKDASKKKSKPENNPRESGYTLMTGSDEYFNETGQQQNNARVGNKPEWVGWSTE